jgi:hypothetical protein
LSLTLTGSNFVQGGYITALVRWTPANGQRTYLQTKFVSDREVTAAIPSWLLISPGQVQVAVVNGDMMGISDGYEGYPQSNAVTFTITPR